MTPPKTARAILEELALYNYNGFTSSSMVDTALKDLAEVVTTNEMVEAMKKAYPRWDMNLKGTTKLFEKLSYAIKALISTKLGGSDGK
jgi:hypothetical protein